MPWDIFMLVLRLFWRRMGLLLAANLLWLGLSLLVVTWPAATAGLFYLARRLAEEELTADPRPTVIGDFWAGFRMYWRPSSVLAIGDIACLVAIVVALRFYGESAVAPLSWLVGPLTLVGLAWAGAQLYLYPLLIQRAERQPWAIAREAFLIAISYPLNTLSLLLTTLVFSVGATVLAGPILLVFFSFMAILQTMALRYILAQRGEISLVLTPERREAREREGKP
jgi:uncharacterized membrane protein YesL